MNLAPRRIHTWIAYPLAHSDELSEAPAKAEHLVDAPHSNSLNQQFVQNTRAKTDWAIPQLGALALACQRRTVTSRTHESHRGEFLEILTFKTSETAREDSPVGAFAVAHFVSRAKTKDHMKWVKELLSMAPHEVGRAAPHQTHQDFQGSSDFSGV
jgi:hypothetical protein